MAEHHNDGALTSVAYAAERSIDQDLILPIIAGPVSPRLADGEFRDQVRGEITRIVRSVTATRWWSDAGGPERLEVRLARPGARYARGGWSGHWYGPGSTDDRRWYVRFAATPFLSSRMVIAHELAHVIHIVNCGPRGVAPDGAGHGPAWAGAYLHLTGMLCGSDTALALSHAFVAYGIGPDIEWLPASPDDVAPAAPPIRYQRPARVRADAQLALL